MSFNSNAPYTDLRADTLFCRFKDPAMSSALVRFAKAWCVPGATNFSKLHAGFAPWHRKHLHERSRARLLGVTADLTRGRPVTDPDGKPSRVMCSEFVADVGAAAAMALHCRDQGLPEDSPVGLQGLRQGHGGSVFDGDPRGTVPMALHARMVADPAVSVVGYIPAPLGAKGF